ncbi:MAG TPA: phosphatidylglycerol lysyltransferase domain-containing protein [Patescibacteria group bacterium]|nr:phosphatidylglycerol lysyltransferase domain-containing protein [Patescibacteria group bacterium]
MSSLPIFPNFEPLDLRHKDVLRKVAEEFPTYSDFNFVSMFTWDNEGTISVADLYGNLVVQFSDYGTGDIFLSFLGVNKISDTIDTLLKYCTENGIEKKLRLIGQSVIDSLTESESKKYEIEDDRDNHDYILSASLMSDIANAAPQKRTKYRHFTREHGHKAVSRLLDLGSNSAIQEIDNLLLEWQKIRSKNDNEVVREFSAIRRALVHADALNMVGYGTYVDNQLVAFTLFEIVHNKTAMLHFGKINTSFTGANEAHHNRLANYLVSLGIEFMNNEQDLGVEGLRHAKMASQPVDFLKKYTISLANIN